MKTKHILQNLAMVFTMALFFQCKNNFKEVQQIGVLQNEPVGIADHINLKYTDSGKITANLISPKMLDYSNMDFGYFEFPEGIRLILFDKDQNQTVVTSDYAVNYIEKNLIDLRGNVVLATYNKDTLFTEQLYYNEKLEWIFTDKPFRMRSTTQNTLGLHLDSDIDFKDIQILGMNDSDFQIEN
ncbi:LPS export ABC transporter periplasmic protein LptC [Winogradskyella sp. 3972H.M.0a.05]|uniref:LPS export ABC transporter periplasmic protein LptC n=1 Tax=Winogradskyella sp. 3972H.M.0a.05 TaxID=2950277 RepID=UPI0033980CD0